MTEHNANMRAGDVSESVRDVLETFEAWADRQVLTAEAAEHVNHIVGYLRMDQPLPACLRANLARHVEAVGKSVL